MAEEAIKLFLQDKLDVDYVDGNDNNLLHMLLISKNEKIEDYLFLIEKGVDLNKLNFEDESPLEIACSSERPNPQLISILLNAKASITFRKDQSLFSVFSIIAANDTTFHFEELVKLFIEKGFLFY